MEYAEGDHFWALYSGKLLVVVKVQGDFYVAGPWEIPLAVDQCGLSILERINRPDGYEETEVYYN